MQKILSYYKTHSFKIAFIITLIGFVNFFIPFYGYTNTMGKTVISRRANYHSLYWLIHYPYDISPVHLFWGIVDCIIIAAIIYSIILLFVKKRYSILPSLLFFIAQTVVLIWDGRFFPGFPFIGYFISLSLFGVALTIKLAIFKCETLPKIIAKVTTKAALWRDNHPKKPRKPTKSERIAQLEERLAEIENQKADN